MSALQQSNLGKIFAEYNGMTAEQVFIPPFFYTRHRSGIESLDVIFGGRENPGLRPCTNVMLSAVRGGGKTTMLIQLLSAYVDNGVKAAYISNEESIPEVSILCHRLGKTNIPLYNENDVDAIMSMIDQHKLDVIVIDSFNGLTTKRVDKKKSEYAIVQLMNRIADYKNGHPCSVIMCVHALADGSGAKTGVGSQLGHCLHMVMQIDKLEGKNNPYELDNVRKIYTDKNRTGQLEKMAFQLTSTGYDFTNPLQPVEEEKDEKSDGRSAEKNRRIDAILLKLLDSDKVTLEDVTNMNICSEQVARLDLKFLEDQKKAEKIGRGKHGYWQKIVDKQV